MFVYVYVYLYDICLECKWPSLRGSVLTFLAAAPARQVAESSGLSTSLADAGLVTVRKARNSRKFSNLIWICFLRALMYIHLSMYR